MRAAVRADCVMLRILRNTEEVPRLRTCIVTGPGGVCEPGHNTTGLEDSCKVLIPNEECFHLVWALRALAGSAHGGRRNCRPAI